MTSRKQPYVVHLEVVAPLTPELREAAVELLRGALADMESNPQFYPLHAGQPDAQLYVRGKNHYEMRVIPVEKGA